MSPYFALLQMVPNILETGESMNVAHVSKQKYDYITDQGRMEITCSWCGKYDDQPAYIRITWKTFITKECGFVARFINPVDNEIRCEISLGEYRTGAINIAQDELGFDPVNEKWAFSILMVKLPASPKPHRAYASS